MGRKLRTTVQAPAATAHLELFGNAGITVREESYLELYNRSHRTRERSELKTGDKNSKMYIQILEVL